MDMLSNPVIITLFASILFSIVANGALMWRNQSLLRSDIQTLQTILNKDISKLESLVNQKIDYTTDKLKSDLTHSEQIKKESLENLSRRIHTLENLLAKS